VLLQICQRKTRALSTKVSSVCLKVIFMSQRPPKPASSLLTSCRASCSRHFRSMVDRDCATQSCAVRSAWSTTDARLLHGHTMELRPAAWRGNGMPISYLSHM